MLISRIKPLNLIRYLSFAVANLLIIGCSSFPGTSQKTLPTATLHSAQTSSANNYNYLIGPGDQLNIFVWRNPEVSGSFSVRPDGKITTSLVEDIDASGLTPAQLARKIEQQLGVFLKDPVVTVTVNRFVGPYSEQVRVIGEAAQPRAINYAKFMTLLDVMIAVGGLTEYADGNDAVLIRIVDGSQKEYPLAISDLIQSGDIKANVDILPGDVIVIPESWF